MAGTTIGGSGGSGGATGRTVDIVNAIATQATTDSFTGAVATANTGVYPRSGSITAAAEFPNGGGGGMSGIAPNPNIGRPHVFFAPGLLRDQYAAKSPGVPLNQPTRDFFNPFQVWEVEAHLICNAPAAAIVDDAGLLIAGSTSITGWGSTFINGGGLPAPGSIGMMVSFFDGPGAGTNLRFFARKVNAGAFTVNQILETGAQLLSPRVVRVLVRLEGATVAAQARLRVFIDETVKVDLRFTNTAAGVLPDQVNNPLWLGMFRPFIRNGGNAAANMAVSYAYWAVRAAPSIAEMNSPAPL